jgi:ABC-type dipeptide/oligopeptide/nickel transport system ATPase component
MTSLHPLRRIDHQLREALELHRGITGSRARAVALELLDEVGIVDPEARLEAWPHQLSGGMRQRVVIAMALAGNPELLIADEPTTALDVTTQANVLDRLHQLCRTRNAALLFITHDLSVVSQLCDRVLVMYRGSIVERGTTPEVLAAPQHDYAKRLLRAVPRLGHPEHILAKPEATS